MKISKILSIIFIGLLLTFTYDCKKQTPKLIPTLETAIVTNITSTSATCGGKITSDGGVAVTSRGVCWSTSQNPTIANSKTSNGTGTGSFTSSLTGLTPGATYYVRAYATNGVGTAYGNQVTATTTAILSALTTTAISAVTATTLTSGGNITSDGGGAITARGVCWSTNQNPTISDSKTSDGTGTGIFISSITGLTPGTTYYVRAYATNSIGTNYGNQVSVTTLFLPPFIIIIKTDILGIPGLNQMTIRTSGSGYNIKIDWGDNSSSNYSGAPGDVTHTYSSAGTYTVKVYGTFPTISFNNDCLKLLSIEQWGKNKWSTFYYSFFGCSNLVIHTTDLPDSGSVLDFTSAWEGCEKLTSFPLIDTSSGTIFQEAWRGCTGLTSFPLIDTSSGTNFQSAWTACTELTSFPLIDTSSGTNFQYAWFGCWGLKSFPLINTSSGTDFSYAWVTCGSLTSFPLIDVHNGINFTGTWNGCNSLTSFPQLNMNKMMYGESCFRFVTLPIDTYTNMLIDLAKNNPNNRVTFDGGTSKYNSTAVTSRTTLTTSPRNWTISDGGLQ